MDAAPHRKRHRDPESDRRKARQPTESRHFFGHPEHGRNNLKKSGNFPPGAWRELADPGKSHQHSDGHEYIKVTAEDEGDEPPGRDADGGKGQKDAAEQALIRDRIDIRSGLSGQAEAPGRETIQYIGCRGESKKFDRPDETVIQDCPDNERYKDEPE